MDMFNLNSLFAASLSNDDYVGFTFFVGSMAMAAATVFFFMERGSVEGKWKTSLLVSGLITFIAAVHYSYMRGYWIDNGTSPTALRYIDWTLTVPLMCVEFYLILKSFGAKIGLMWKMIFFSVGMLVTGYLGETVFRDSNVIWGIISTLFYLGIVYEIWFGGAKKLAASSNDPHLQKAFRALGLFVLIGWGIYPIGYCVLPGNILHGVLAIETLDLAYNLGDAINKIGFGLVIYGLAVNSKNS
ncbi:MAG TPA: rhodopsin [Cytophagales bacterium]|nr:rhodopsin [Cytophagales bacterium]